MANEALANGLFWCESELKTDVLKKYKIGDLRFWCVGGDNLISLAYQYINGENYEKDAEQPPDDIKWNRWSLPHAVEKLKLSPLFPDKPIVVKPEINLKVPTNVTTRFFVRIPVWVKLELLQNKTKTELVDLPSVALSPTWFGTPMEGDLCYWITSSAKISAEPDISRNHMILCPISLTNKSDVELEITKLKIQVSSLSVFFDDQQLWSDDINITYRGEQDLSQIKVSGKAPNEAPEAIRLVLPRSDAKKSFTSRTFSTFKILSGFSTNF